MKFATKLLCGVMLLGTLAFAQGSYTTTTLNGAVTSASQTSFNLTSATGIVPSVGGNAWGLYVDKEYMRVTAVSSNTVSVIRGASGTKATAHITGAVVWAAPPNYFTANVKAGACTPGNETVNPVINVTNAEVYDCDAATGEWAVQREFFVPPDFCGASTTGTAGTGNNTVILDGSVSALKVASTNGGASHNVFTCSINIPARLDAIRGAKITAVVFDYSQQGSATGLSQVAPVLNSFTAPVPKTSETASSATLVAAGGTLTITPVIGSANLTAISAGQYYTTKIALGSPINLSANPLQSLVLAVEFDQSGSTVTTITTPGFWVYYTEPSPVDQVLD